MFVTELLQLIRYDGSLSVFSKRLHMCRACYMLYHQSVHLSHRKISQK